MLIDGTNIVNYGAISLRGNASKLLSYPQLRDPDSQEWAEYDGVQVDLSDPKLKEREFDLEFSANSVDEMESFVAELSKTGYREVELPLLNKTWRLRYLSQGDPDYYQNGVVFSVKFSDDFPRLEGVRSGHGLPVPELNNYFMDGINLSDYGLLVLSAKPSLYKAPALRESLKISNSVMDGVIYDVEMANFKPKEVTFRLAFYCDTAERLLDNHGAFLSDIVAANERNLATPYMVEEPKFYYKSASNFEFNFTNAFSILEFDLTVVFTSFRPSLLDILLATQIFELVITEDGVNFINLNPN